MSKKKYWEEDAQEGRAEAASDETPSSTLPTEDEDLSAEGEPSETVPPSGLKELNPMEAAILDNWERRVEDGRELWVNRRDFNTKGGAVPQGTVRSLEEAYALEVQKIG